MNQQDKIVTHRENRTTHYHLRRRGYGRLQPLTDDQVHQLRLQGVPIDLPMTAPLRPFADQEASS